jgi:transposase
VLTLLASEKEKGQGSGMELTEEHLCRIKASLPVERGNVSLSQRAFLNAVLYVAENGCKWRRLPKELGNWHTIYTRMSRWSKAGVLDRIFARLQQEGILLVRLEVLSLDSTIVKVHPDGTGARKKTVLRPSASPGADGPARFIWLPRMIASP